MAPQNRPRDFKDIVEKIPNVATIEAENLFRDKDGNPDYNFLLVLKKVRSTTRWK